MCWYVRGQRPGCIIGHALRYAGVPLRMLRDLDQLSFPGMGSMSFAVPLGQWSVDHLRSQGVRITPEAVKAFAAAQEVQDRGLPWGEAVKVARET